MLSFIPSLRRVFQYHAAEHKAINAYEAGEELTPENAQRYSLIHPRCGTAFLLWVMVVGVFVYALLGRPAWYWLIVSRIVLLPVIAGIAYELIRFAGKHSDNRVLMTLLAPGPLAAAADDARADARPARGVDPRAAGSARSRGPASAGRPTSGGDGVMATERKAEVVWQGDLMNGSGTIGASTSGAFGPLDVSWAFARRGAERQDEPGGADRRRVGVVLRDGALERAREGGQPAREARDVCDGHVPARRRDHERRAHRARARSRDSTRDGVSRRPPKTRRQNCPVSQGARRASPT